MKEKERLLIVEAGEDLLKPKIAKLDKATLRRYMTTEGQIIKTTEQMEEKSGIKVEKEAKKSPLKIRLINSKSAKSEKESKEVKVKSEKCDEVKSESDPSTESKEVKVTESRTLRKKRSAIGSMEDLWDETVFEEEIFRKSNRSILEGSKSSKKSVVITNNSDESVVNGSGSSQITKTDKKEESPSRPQGSSSKHDVIPHFKPKRSMQNLWNQEKERILNSDDDKDGYENAADEQQSSSLISKSFVGYIKIDSCILDSGKHFRGGDLVWAAKSNEGSFPDDCLWWPGKVRLEGTAINN